MFAILDGILASHFRFGSLSWSRDASTQSNVYKIVVEAHVAYRRVSWVGNLNEGDTYKVWDRLYWGDNKYDRLRNLTVSPGGVFYGKTSSDHWSDSKGTMSHVYKKSFLDDVIANKGGLFQIKVASCCRVARGKGYSFHATVNATEFMAYKSSPKASIFPLLTLGARTGSPSTVQVRATSGNGVPLKFNWTSGRAMCNVRSRWSRPCKNGNDLGASLNSNTGEITWMTNKIGLFAMQVVAYNPITQSASAVDFIVKTIDGVASLKYCNSTGSRCRR